MKCSSNNELFGSWVYVSPRRLIEKCQCFWCLGSSRALLLGQLSEFGLLFIFHVDQKAKQKSKCSIGNIFMGYERRSFSKFCLVSRLCSNILITSGCEMLMGRKPALNEVFINLLQNCSEPLK